MSDIFQLIKEKNFLAVKKLLEEDPTAINNRYVTKNLTILHFAVLVGDEGIVDLILEKIKNKNIANYDVNVGDIDNSTSLHWAAKIGRENIIMKLLDNGANIGAKNIHNLTPLHLAVSNDKKDSIGSITILLDRGANIDSTNHENITSLHLAITKRSLDITKLLVKKGANIHHRDNNGTTPISLAAYHADKAIMEFLLSQNADLNYKGLNNESLIHIVALSTNDNLEQIKESISYLVEQGLNINALDKDGHTPITYAENNNSTKFKNEIVQFLKEIMHTQNFNFAAKYGSRSSDPSRIH